MSTLGMFSTSGGYHDECGGDTMSTSWDVQYIRRCSVHRGMFSTSEGYHDTCVGAP